MNLLHLVSEQTIQNLLPILALRPKTVIQVRSREPRFAKAAKSLQAAVAAMCESPLYPNLDPEFIEEVIDADSPSPDETRRKVGGALALWPGCVVNLTGGTKLMSIGAWLSAEYQHEPILYCDTAHRAFLFEGKTQPPLIDPFEQVAASLTVKAVMAAQGVPPADWKFETPDAALIAFGLAAHRIKTAHPDSFRDLPPDGSRPRREGYNSVLRIHFRLGKRSIPGNLNILRKLLSNPLPTPPDRPAQELLEAALEAGLVWRSPGGGYHPKSAPVKSAVERIANLLDGSWLELFVLDRLQHSNGRFTDPHWSVRPQNDHDSAIGENDLVCIDTARAGLRLISCKVASPDKPLEHLTALAERRRELGGSHATATLALLIASDEQSARLRSWGRILGIEVLIGAELQSLGTPP